MTRIAYRRSEEMTDQARELTHERGNLNVYRALANADKVFTGWMLAGRALLTSPVLSVRLRELVVLRTAYLMDCPYELGQHRDVARTAGSAATRSTPFCPSPIGRKVISTMPSSRCCT